MTSSAPLLVTAALALEGARAGGLDLSPASLGRSLRAVVAEDPTQALVGMVLGSSALFFLAERGHNPKVQRFEDALVYCTTSLSVGSTDIFARTPAGKAIGSMLMTFGPAFAARALEPPRRELDAERAELLEVQRAIATKLDAILEALRGPHT